MSSILKATISALTLTALSTANAYAADKPKVVVSIPPIHALVAGVMEGVGEPTLLVTGGTSPHSHSLRPSQARALNEARVVVLVSGDLENFLERPVQNLAGKADVITLAEVKGMTLHVPREGGVWEKHDHDDEPAHGNEKHAEHAHKEKHEKHAHKEKHDDHEHGEVDPHLWLDPLNAKRIVSAVSMTLRKAYPDHAQTFATNTQKLHMKLDELDQDLLAATKPLRGKPYIVFHDAYRYFDERYKLTPAGAITVSPDRPAGARRLREIRERLQVQKVACVFTEPQFQPILVQSLISGTSAQAGTLDPIGAGLNPSPELYFTLMRKLASNMAACLKNPS